MKHKWQSIWELLKLDVVYMEVHYAILYTFCV